MKTHFNKLKILKSFNLKMENSISNNKTIKLPELLAVVFDNIEKTSKLFSELIKGDYTMEIYKKGPADQFTSIDWTVQKMMENYLKFYFSESIKIIGEEDTSKDLLNSDLLKVNEKLNLDWNIVEIPKEISELSLEDVKIYIDPIDATRQLVKKNFSPCTILVGITYKNFPFVGIVNYPVYEETQKSITYFNIPSKGIFEYNVTDKIVKNLEIPKNDKLELIVRSNMNRHIDKDHGYGHKGIESLKKNSTFYFKASGINTWDTCAVHALAKEITGGIFSLEGEELEYNDVTDQTGFLFPVVFFPQKNKMEIFYENIK